MRLSPTIASLPRRALALLIDWLIIGCPLLLHVARANYEFMYGFGEACRALFPSLALVAVNDWMLVAMRGQSVGKIILGIAVVNSSGEHPTWWLAFIRTFTRFGIAGMLFCLAPLWLLIDALAMLFNPDRQTIHDMAAGTYVCRIAGGKRAPDE